MAKVANGSIIPEEIRNQNIMFKKVASQQNIKNYINKMINDIKLNEKYNIKNNSNVNNNQTNIENNIQNNIIPRHASVSGNRPNFNQLKEYYDKSLQIKDILTYKAKQSINLDNIGSINYSSYFESNILKLLSYLKQFNIDNYKIVSHSALMKKFLNQKIILDKKEIDDKLKKIEKKENMWSIILNDGEICITRHAFTIANLYKEEGQKMNQFFDKDTTLSLYGILGALNFNNPQHINLKNCNNTVFVSVLVRTWITALCLYLPQIDRTGGNNKFTLVVSPFIKESTKYIGIIRDTDDNLPIPINKQIIIIKNFLKFLREKISSNLEPVLEEYIKSSNNIRDFFNTNGVLEIYGVKELKDKKFKYVKYEIRYNSNKRCYISTNKKKNYFGTIVKLKKVEEQSTRSCGIFGCKKYSEKLKITQLQILPGVRKPTTELNVDKEPLSKVKVNTFKNIPCNIIITIIDIDEEGNPFNKADVTKFYNTNKEVFEDSNILVVCTQRSLSLGTTNHFQHLLKEVLEEQSNTNFNFKNSNKKNTTQALPFKSFSAISGSKTGLRTRVYTQGLDNDKLNIKFDTVDFSATSSNEGAILCNINYDGEDLIKVLNLYADVKNTENINIHSNDSKRKNYIQQKIINKFNIVLPENNILYLKDNVYNSGKSKSIFIQNPTFFKNSTKTNIKYFKFNKDLNSVNKIKKNIYTNFK
jgi:hypothetical protein